jgi:hypothetical protein
MKRIVAAIASLSALVSCATAPDDTPALRVGGAPPFSATQPNVYLLAVGSDVKLAVDQEPLVFQGNTGRKKIKWKLRDSEYKLDRIEFQPDAKGNNPASGCTGESDDTVFSCDNDTSVVGTFKYSIRATPKRPGLPTPPILDPTVVNN